MGVVIVQRLTKAGKLQLARGVKKERCASTWHVRWNRRREDRPRCVFLGAWPEKAYADARRDKALLMLAMGEEPSREKLDRIGLVTIDDVITDWLASQHDAASTLAKKVIYTKKISARWGGKAPANLSKADVQSWINELVGEGKGRGTIMNHLATLRPLMRHADVEPVWMRGTKILSIPHDAWEAMDLPNRERREAARACLSPRFATIFDLCEHGGLRSSEACLLTGAQIGSFEGQPALIHIGTKYVRKGGKPPRSVREMPELGQPSWVPVRDGDGPVFGGATAKSFGVALDRACTKAGVERFTPKALRHLHATRLSYHSAKHGLGLHGMAKRMGHDQAVFLDRYSDHPLPDSE